MAITNSFTAGEKRSIVIYNWSATPGKRRMTAVLGDTSKLFFKKIDVNMTLRGGGGQAVTLILA